MKIPSFPFFIRIKEYFSSGDMLVSWYHHYKLLIFIGFLITLSFGGWSYYYNMYQYRFSDAEKKQYRDSYFKEITFKEAAFNATVESLRKRAWTHGTTPNLKQNIFLK